MLGSGPKVTRNAHAAVKLVSEVVTTAMSVASVWLLWVILTVDTAGGAASPRPTAPERSETPDLILITVDTLRADRVGVYGYKRATTPHIDALAEAGITFLHATVPVPRTTPGLASLMTGLTPEHHGSREVWEPVERGTMLAEILARRGYQTIGISANSAAGTRQGFQKGFEKFIDRKNLDKRFGDAHAAFVTDWANELLNAVSPDRPLFLWVHYVDPHWPYTPPRKYWRLQPSGKKCHEARERVSKKQLTLGHLTVDWHGSAVEALRDCSAMYDAEVAFTDHEIGRLIAKLEELGRWSGAIKVFTADHGENFGEDGYYFNHGPSLADGPLRVPLIMSGPGIIAGKRDAGITRIEDVMPTILQILRVPAEEWSELDGFDLSYRWDPSVPLPEKRVVAAVAESGGALHLGAHDFLVSGRADQEYCVNEPRYSMCFEKAGAPPLFFDREVDPFLRKPTEIPEDIKARLAEGARLWGPESARSRCVRTPTFKLVAYPRLEGGYTKALYDLVNDAHESRNVIADHPEVAAELDEILERWEADLPIYRARERSTEAVEELRSLGYLGL